jgi:hypothetical protein
VRRRIKQISAAVTLLFLAALVRRHCHRLGASRRELQADLPGDELIDAASLTVTRAISIDAPPEAVWPWIAQIGQGRGGLYSYDFLENLLGCDIHSADRVIPELQSIRAGDEVRLHPQVPLKAQILLPGEALVLRGGVPLGDSAPPYDFTWAFILRERDESGSRLIVRERYRYLRRWTFLLVEPVELVSYVMSRKMIRGIKTRAERG